MLKDIIIPLFKEPNINKAALSRLIVMFGYEAHDYVLDLLKNLKLSRNYHLAKEILKNFKYLDLAEPLKIELLDQLFNFASTDKWETGIRLLAIETLMLICIKSKDHY